MAVREILRLGNPRLYEVSSPVEQQELDTLPPIIEDLRDTLFDFREKYNIGRAIAAPQIGIMKRIIYMHIDEPKIFINPVLFKKSNKMITLWDDCMSFPELLVRVERHKTCQISYRDENWNKKTEWLEDDKSELLQHECDHLFGILAVSRAVDDKSLVLKSEEKFISGRRANPT